MLKRYITTLIGIVLSLTANSQTLTVSQLESQWHNLYLKCCKLLESDEYDAAEESVNKSIELLVFNDASNSKYHIYALIKLGEIYYQSKDKVKLESCINQLESVKQFIRPGSKRYIDYLYHAGIYYSYINRIPDAIQKFNEALGCTETLMKMEGFNSKLLHELSLCQYKLGNIREAIKYEKEAINNDFNKTPQYSQALAFYYYMSDDWDSLEAIIKTCYNNSREPVLRKFSQSKAKDRAAYWSRAGHFFTDFLPVYALEHPSAELLSYAYNSALFSKGVLLAAENKSNDLALNSDDPELIKLFERYLALKDKKNKTLDETFEMEALSDVVLRYQKEHKNEYRKDFRIGWTDVQAKLTDEDIAIEFITIPNSNGIDDYAALIIKKGYTAPKLVKLADFNKFASIPASNIYTTSEYYELVWEPLEAYIAGARNIYFSPAGIFYNTAIEYLPNQDDININILYNIWRLSSTKELVLSESKSFNKCALFGGINYNTSVSTLAKQSPTYTVEEGMNEQVSLDSLDLRAASISGGFSYLDGTMEEVGNISMMCLESDIQVDMYCDNEGSETTFKNLSGSDINVLHIATHGFYYANKSIGRKLSLDKLFHHLSCNNHNEYFDPINEDKMLTRSGLILAGANNILKRIQLPQGVEDGILYANEVANLNLNKTNLLVLSACQSGLGDINSSEGVFGLQRGFKLAGARTIVMSLWKVNDKATQILMSEMYKNIGSGQSIREALTNAQLTLRTAEGGYFDKPEYWAGFIILDGLN